MQQTLAVILAASISGLFGVLPAASKAPAGAKAAATPAPPDWTFSGPFTHENLTVFLIHGKEARPGKTWLTLQEAMEKKKVKVYETGEVNELSIENIGDDEVFVQSGEIVKGGRQDRTVAFDLIVPAKSGRLPISSFCVEQGRWRPRGKELSTEFSMSTATLSTKGSKMAARKDNDQGKVWAEVGTTQSKLEKNLDAKVKSVESESSLQLTLENKKVKDTADAYQKKLGTVADGKDDVIGFAFAINGKVNSAEVYASKALFKKLWPKMMQASAVEAVAELEPGKTHPTVTADAVKAALADAEKGKATEKNVGKRAKMTTKETDANVMFETIDLAPAADGEWVHRSYIVK